MLAIVVGDEGLDLGFEVTWQIIVLQQDRVLQGLLPPFDFSQGLGVIGSTTVVLYISIIGPFGQVARIEATIRSFDTRYNVTSLPGVSGGDARHLYEDVCRIRGQAENLIKMHNVQLASVRTSCLSPIANRV